MATSEIGAHIPARKNKHGYTQNRRGVWFADPNSILRVTLGAMEIS